MNGPNYELPAETYTKYPTSEIFMDGAVEGYKASQEKDGLPINPSCIYDTNRVRDYQKTVELLINRYTERIRALREQLEYEQLKNKAYQMVWSARQYLAVQNLDNAINNKESFNEQAIREANYQYADTLLRNILWDLDIERIDGKVIKEKYIKAMEDERIKYAEPLKDVVE